MNPISSKRGFGLIGILIVMLVVFVLYFMKTDVFKSTQQGIKQKVGYIESRVQIKHHVERQVKDIQALAKKRYG